MAKRSTPTPIRSERPEPKPEPESSAAPIDRIAIPMVDGKPAFDRMRETTRENLRKIVSDPDTARALGLGTTDAPTQMIPLDLARAALVAWSQLTTLGVAMITKASAPILREHMPYSETALDQMSPLAQRVISKHAGPKITKWSDEIALGAMLLTDLQMRLALVREAMRATTAPTATPNPPTTPLEIVRPASVEPDTVENPT